MAGIRTFAQARAFVKRVGICGIFAEVEGHSLWEATDLPGRQPGERGWGEKVSAVWQWKNLLPARHPDEIFYGKVKGGKAVLMSMARLREHYPQHHRPVRECSAVAQRIYQALKFDPMTTPELRRHLDMTHPPERNQFERGLKELQITLNIARRNSEEDENDTWVLFREQYLEIAGGAQ